MKILKLLMSVAVCSLLATASAVFAQAATVFELIGTATAAVAPPAAAPGAPAAPVPVGRTLRKGDAVNQGEIIATGAMSSIVLRFADGQIAALSANSRMAINNYVYNAAEPAKSNVLLSLLNGGMRAVTGLIGKARPQAVAFRAGNATIGIRGTDATFTYAPGQSVTVTVANGSVSYTFPNGASFVVPAGQGTIVPPTATMPTPVVSIAAVVQQIAAAAQALAAEARKPDATPATIAAALAAQNVVTNLTAVTSPGFTATVNTVVTSSPGTSTAGVAASTATAAVIQAAITAGQTQATAAAAAAAAAPAASTGTPTGTGTPSSGSGGSTSVACTTVSPVRLPAGCVG